MLRTPLSLTLRVSALLGVMLAGCTTASRLESIPARAGASGAMHGGQQPISGVTVQLYSVGTSGDGSAATPLLTRPVTTDAGGYFNITGLYTCPSASTLVYVTGTGGSPAPGLTNPQIALMGAIGPCGSLSPSSFLNIDELTTVAAVYALAPFISSYSAIGSGLTDTTALASAFTQAGYFANLTTGTTPGAGVPSGYAVPVVQMNTIADLLAACINSGGGVSGDTSVCGQFFALTLPSGATASIDTIGALLHLADNPTLNTASLYNLVPPAAPFQPTDAIVPADLALRLTAPSTFGISPSSLSFAAEVVNFTQPVQTLTVTNGGSVAVNVAASISGLNAGDFAIAAASGNDCGTTVLANSSCTFEVSFAPSATGTRAAYFVLANSSANPSLAVALAGNGSPGAAGPVSLTPSGLAFTLLGTPQTLTLANQGTSPLTINSIQISNAAYTQTNNCGASLPASGTCSIYVAVPSYTTTGATLTVIDDAAAGPQTASLSYTGSGDYIFAPTVDFGHWAIGAVGNEFLQVVGPGTSGSMSFTLTGANAADFSFSQTSPVTSTSCSYQYRSGSYCYLSIYYKPSAVATSTATVNIAGVGSFTLLGEGNAAGVDFDLFQPVMSGVYSTLYSAPITSLNAGSSTIGSATTAGFAVKNTGTTTLALNAPVISGPNASEFAVSGPSCGSGCTPTVTFTPAGTGTRSATLTYSDSSNAVTRTLALSGTGTTPVPELTSSNSLTFSNVPIGTTSASQSITVNAYHNDPIQATLTSTFSGGPQPFVFTGPTFCASTPCTLSIAYAPKSASDNGATVYVNAMDTVGHSSGNIQAYGQVGTLAAVSFTPGSLTFASQALHTASAAQTVTLTNIGSTTLHLTFAFDSYPNDYTSTSHCPASLAINSNCTVDVQFTPTDATGTLASDLVITGAQNTQYVSLTGSAH